MTLSKHEKEMKDVKRRIKSLYADACASKDIDKGIYALHKAFNKATGRTVDDYTLAMGLYDLRLIRNEFARQLKPHYILAEIDGKFVAKAWSEFQADICNEKIQRIDVTYIAAPADTPQHALHRYTMRDLADALNKLLAKTPENEQITVTMILQEMDGVGDEGLRKRLYRYGVSSFDPFRFQPEEVFLENGESIIPQRLPPAFTARYVVKSDAEVVALTPTLYPPKHPKRPVRKPLIIPPIGGIPPTQANQKYADMIQYIIDTKTDV